MEQDRLDPRSLQHVLPGAAEPSYEGVPPTSGPHQAVDLPGGLQSGPLPAPVQVGVLEEGGVIIQYRDLKPDELGRLVALGGPEVLIAPQPQLADRVVVTAWTVRQRCHEADVGALRRFVARYQGKGIDG